MHIWHKHKNIITFTRGWRENHPLITMSKEFNQYEISWVEIRPTKGICNQADQKAMNLDFLTLRYNKGNKCIYLHFPNKDKAQSFISGIDASKLSKQYCFTICTDRQFGAAKVLPKGELIIDFTAKQIEEQVIL